ncbi:MAG: GNAT family N-acetyltransferase [Patescibacteria group bacterium]|jgi:predicted N-acetyltransferase YhbS
MDIRIRLIEEAELESVSQVFTEAFNNAGVGENWSVERAIKYLRYLYQHQPDLFFIAEAEGEIVGGVAGVIRTWGTGNYLGEWELFVKPEYQKQGIAAKLLTNIVRSAIDNHAITMFSGLAFSGKAFPMEWYKQIGFHPSGWVHIEADAKELLSNLIADHGQNQ